MAKRTASGSTEETTTGEGRIRPIPTKPARLSERRLVRGRWVRRTVMGALVAFVALGAAGLLGSRTSSATSRSNGFVLTVTYPAISRPGLPVRWDLTLTKAGGFDGPIHVALPMAYFRMLDFNNLQPQPSATHNRGDLVVMDFDPPDGVVFEASLDARLQPGVLSGASAVISVMIHGSPVVSVAYRTRVIP
jgi:hypothetical protein